MNKLSHIFQDRNNCIAISKLDTNSAIYESTLSSFSDKEIADKEFVSLHHFFYYYTIVDYPKELEKEKLAYRLHMDLSLQYYIEFVIESDNITILNNTIFKEGIYKIKKDLFLPLLLNENLKGNLIGVMASYC